MLDAVAVHIQDIVPGLSEDDAKRAADALRRIVDNERRREYDRVTAAFRRELDSFQFDMVIARLIK